MVTTPEFLSVSQARLFEGCPKAFAFRYVNHLDLAQEPNEPRDFGRAVHAGLAAGYKLLQGAQAPLTLHERNVVREASVAALEERWFAECLSIGESYDEAHEHVLAEWDDHGRRTKTGHPSPFDRIPNVWQVVGVEQGFRQVIRGLAVSGTPGGPVEAKEAELAVTGVIDLALYAPELRMLRIIDHKTGSYRPSFEELRTDDQLRLYGAVAHQLFGNLFAGAFDIHAGMNFTSSVDNERQSFFLVTDADIRGIISKLWRTRTRIDTAAERNEFPARPGPRCNYCDYQHVCPAALVALRAKDL